jgi:hypothetical protein
MLILTIGGLLGILSTGKRKLQIAAMFIGTGMGLFADEIGLLLNCTSSNRICVYAFPDTLDIVFAIALAIVSTMVLTDLIERSQYRKKLNAGNNIKQPE